MPDRMSRRGNRDESADALRERQSAREVAEWEAAFRAPRPDPAPPPTMADDRANAGAVVSRAHRAEKTSGGRDLTTPDEERPWSNTE